MNNAFCLSPRVLRYFFNQSNACSEKYTVRGREPLPIIPSSKSCLFPMESNCSRFSETSSAIRSPVEKSDSNSVLSRRPAGLDGSGALNNFWICSNVRNFTVFSFFASLGSVTLSGGCPVGGGEGSVFFGQKEPRGRAKRDEVIVLREFPQRLSFFILRA